MSNLIAKFDMLYLSSSKPLLLAPCSLARCWREEVCLQMPWLFWVCCHFLQVLLKQTVLVSFSEKPRWKDLAWRSSGHWRLRGGWLWSLLKELDPCMCVCMRVLVAHLCPTLWDPMDCNPPGSSVYGILQARILEWVAFPFSRGSSWPRGWPRFPVLQEDSLLSEPAGKARSHMLQLKIPCTTAKTWPSQINK